MRLIPILFVLVHSLQAFAADDQDVNELASDSEIEEISENAKNGNQEAVEELDALVDEAEVEAKKNENRVDPASSNIPLVPASASDPVPVANDSLNPAAESSEGDKVIDQKEFMRPASDFSGAESIDIQSRMKKITEPNLFSGAAPNPGSMRNLASGEAPEEYVVQEGDTLYDICDQLIDEAEYWPKLWSFNPTIENPHFVYPGMRLRFYAGDDKSPPFLQVITDEDILPVAKGALNEAELVREDIGGMLMQSEAPEMTQIIDADELDSLASIDGMFIDVNRGYESKSKLVLIPAFITGEDLPEFGRVVGGSAGSFLADKGQQIILKEQDGLKVGTSYSVVRKGDAIKNSSGEVIGRRYEFIAQLKVMTEDGTQEGVYKGNVLFNRLGVEPDDILVSYRSVRRTVPNKAVVDSRGAEQEVVDFTEPNSVLGGRGSFVFLDQTGGKLQENRTYQVVQNVKVAAGKFLRDELPDTDSKVAQVYILDNKGAAAVGYLVEDSFEVRIGDRIAR